MIQTPTHRAKLPVKWWAALLSLGGATATLVIIYVLRQMELMSTEAAIWTAVGVFVAAAIFETILFTVITLHLMQKVGEGTEDEEKE